MTNEELFRLRDYESLYTKNIPFMHSIVQRFSNLPIEKDDLIGCGNVAFMKCVNSYDPDTSKWLTYFSKLMINEILMVNRKVSRRMNYVSLETVTVTDKGNKEITLEHQISIGPLIEDEIMNRVTVEEVLEITKRLPPTHREALRLYLLGKKQREIGAQLNVSQAQVSRLIKKITDQLYRQYMNGA